MKRMLKELKWNLVMLSALYLVMGIILVVFPRTTAQMICYAGGGALIVVGVITMIGYFLNDVRKSYYKNDFTLGLIEILVGMFVLYRSGLFIALVPFVLGIFVMVSGFSKLQDSIDMKRMECRNWYIFLLLSGVNIIFGLVLLLDPFGGGQALIIAIGIGLIFSGASNLFTTFYISQRVREYIDKTQAGERDGEAESGFRENAGESPPYTPRKTFEKESAGVQDTPEEFEASGGFEEKSLDKNAEDDKN